MFSIDYALYQRYLLYGAVLCLTAGGSTAAPEEDPCLGGPVHLEVTDTGGDVVAALDGLPASFGRRINRIRHGGEGVPPYLLLDPADEVADACVPLSTTFPEDTAVLVPRGGCNFAAKAEHLQAANVSLMVLYDTADDSCVLMGHDAAEQRLQTLTGIAGVSVSAPSGKALRRLAAGGGAQLAAWLKKPPVFGAASLSLWALAVGTVAGGAYLAGCDYSDTLRTPVEVHAAGAKAGGDLDTVVLSARSAVAFVAVASTFLVTLFFLLNDVVYYVLLGLYCVASAQAMYHFAHAGLAAALGRWLGHVHATLPLLGRVSLLGGAAGMGAAAVAGGWAACRDAPWAWVVQDGMGVALLLLLLRVVQLPDLRVATVLLTACFCYDVFFVFIQPALSGGASVMVEVASGGSGGHLLPMLLIVPHGGGPGASWAILGYGDVALPGLLVAFSRVWDLKHGGAVPLQERGAAGRVRGGYFVPAVLGYAVGLLATYCALYYDVGGDQGQPALLYLVPGTLGTMGVLAALRGELWTMWHGDDKEQGVEGLCGESGRLLGDEAGLV